MSVPFDYSRNILFARLRRRVLQCLVEQKLSPVSQWALRIAVPTAPKTDIRHVVYARNRAMEEGVDYVF